MNEVTDADRAKAEYLLGDDLSHYYEGVKDAIAKALAEERDKARAPYLALAERWERFADTQTAGLDARKARAAARDLREAAEDQL